MVRYIRVNVYYIKRNTGGTRSSYLRFYVKIHLFVVPKQRFIVILDFFMCKCYMKDQFCPLSLGYDEVRLNNVENTLVNEMMQQCFRLKFSYS